MWVPSASQRGPVVVGGRRQSTRDSSTPGRVATVLASGEGFELGDVISDREEGQRRADLPQRLLGEGVAWNPGVEPIHGSAVASRRRVRDVLVRPRDAAEVDRALLLVGVHDDVAGPRVDDEADED